MDYTPSSRRLSEISHLFLSDVRKVTGEETRPQRVPPGGPTGAFKHDVSIDMTPEEFADVMRPVDTTPMFKPVRVVVAQHLGEAMQARVTALAATLGGDQPVGIIYADAGNVRVCCVDVGGQAGDEPETETYVPQRFREALVELDQDVCEWLLVLPDQRSPDTQALLAKTPRWTLLSGTDHDGVVAAYRTLKGLCGETKPAVSISIFGSPSHSEMLKTSHKLTGVCEQFLKVGVDIGPAADEREDAIESCIYEAATQPNAETHWPVLTALVDSAAESTASPAIESAMEMPVAAVPFATVFDQPVRIAKPAVEAPVMKVISQTIEADDAQTVIDLPADDSSPLGILRAVVRGGSDWVETPVKAPMMADAIVAVSRDRRLTLLAVATPGLADLRTVAAALRWMTENRALIAMAVPQLAINAHAEPRLHLLVDHVDAAADALQPLLAAGSVTVAAYRKLRWSGRTGLLLEAA